MLILGGVPRGPCFHCSREITGTPNGWTPVPIENPAGKEVPCRCLGGVAGKNPKDLWLNSTRWAQKTVVSKYGVKYFLLGCPAGT